MNENKKTPQDVRDQKELVMSSSLEISLSLLHKIFKIIIPVTTYLMFFIIIHLTF